MTKRNTTGSAGCAAHRRGAFTLLELLVVMAIIIVLVAISFPAYRQMTSGNSSRQAINALSIELASAKSLAMSMQRQVALIIYEDPQDNRQSFMILAQAVRDVNGGTEFGAIPERNPVALPRNIKVAALSAATGMDQLAGEANSAASSGSALRLRAVVFNERGLPVLRAGLMAHDLDNNSNPRSARTAWGLAASSGQAANYGSTLNLIAYDMNEFQDAVGQMDDAARAQWLVDRAELLCVQPYSGTLVRDTR